MSLSSPEHIWPEWGYYVQIKKVLQKRKFPLKLLALCTLGANAEVMSSVCRCYVDQQSCYGKVASNLPFRYLHLVLDLGFNGIPKWEKFPHFVITLITASIFKRNPI